MLDLQYIQNLASNTTIQAVLDQTCDKEFLDVLDSLVQEACYSNTIYLPTFLASDIADRLYVKGEVWGKIHLYCEQRFKDTVVMPFYLLECLLRIYQPDDAGAWIAPSILDRLEPHLLFDDDHLLFGPKGSLQFEKEGVLTRKHFLLYDPSLPGTWKSGGFVEELLEIVRQIAPEHFSMAVTTDALLARDLHFTSFTKAYIRGPRGLSTEIFQEPTFPENPAGTVTVHQRVGNDPVFRLFPLHRLEVMWSRRETVKTIQIEELVDPRNNRACTSQGIANRYIHARWNVEKQAFEHFDGAIRIYTMESYVERLRFDLKNYVGKTAAYRKLFKLNPRLDEPLDITHWGQLVTKFFEENELVLEYLGGPEDE